LAVDLRGTEPWEMISAAALTILCRFGRGSAVGGLLRAPAPSSATSSSMANLDAFNQFMSLKHR
jgi:hypothetical protein